MKPLLDVTVTPEFEERLLSEIGREVFRQEVRELLQPVHSGAKRPRRQIRPVEPPADRWEEHRSLIAKAARRAGTDNYRFCKLLGEHRVPVPRRWLVKSWLAAYNKPTLRASIRRFKSRHKS